MCMIGSVGLEDWDRRFREETREELPPPLPFVVEMAQGLEPGEALDLACGSGRHAIWLAQRGWSVTVVDGSAAAIEILRKRSDGLSIKALTADLEKHEYSIAPGAWDLIVISLYLQRDLFEPAKLGVKPGGVLIAITLLAEPGKSGRHRLDPGELKNHFTGWQILQFAEDSGFARIAARSPKCDQQAGRSATEPSTTSG
jgi:tellurite methyltransferase